MWFFTLMKEWTEEFCSYCVCLCPCTEQCVLDSQSTCLWSRLWARALCWRNVAAAKTASTAVPHPYLVYKYQSWKLAHAVLICHNHWASVVLQQQTCSAASFRNTLLLMNRNVPFFFLMYYKPHDVKTISWMTKSKFTGFCFYIGDIKWHSY